jgi:hypothetical protein
MRFFPKKVRPLCLVAIVLAALTENSLAQSYTFQQESLPCVNKKFTLTAHIFADSLGDYGVTETALNNAVSGMNVYFKPIGVSFEFCEFLYHPNFEHDIVEKEEEFDIIKKKYHSNYRINFYFVSELLPGGNLSEAGVATSGIGDLTNNGIFILKGGGVGPGVFSHEMGHLCGLPHTFEGNCIELVNGDNCQTAGDGICDTPADPYDPDQPMANFVDDNCRFIGEQVDANGEFYNPDLGNIMSYYNCGKCGFSWGQLNKMAEVILNGALQMW